MDGDPHIHVQAKVMQDDAAVRSMLASSFGLAGDLPSHVATGCGLQAPRAMTSSEPNRVTCLPCREHAQAEHLRLAEQVERLSRMPGSIIGPAQAELAAERHRDLARRFSGAED
ncbi:hypothetical protein J0910_19200 [Nocardiopsis sp. CNT-189]|uniref:hypothetical protein n=1 Tax=Nocardiopsis oceanisediminis TaxID=2816862 RepID=UPI003B2C7E91